jgi:hypothetical protein
MCRHGQSPWFNASWLLGERQCMSQPADPRGDPSGARDLSYGRLAGSYLGMNGRCSVMRCDPETPGPVPCHSEQRRCRGRGRGHRVRHRCLKADRGASVRKFSNQSICTSAVTVTRRACPSFPHNPNCRWVRQSFFSDPRYRVLKDFQHSAEADAVEETDGAELTLYICREFCENPVPPQVSGPSIHEVVERLRGYFVRILILALDGQPIAGALHAVRGASR